MFSNRSDRGHPTSTPTEYGATPKSEIVCASVCRSSQVAGGSTPASEKTWVLYQTVDFWAARNHTAYRVPSTVPTSLAPGAKFASTTSPAKSSIGIRLPSAAKLCRTPGCGRIATSGGWPPSILGPRYAAMSSPADRNRTEAPVSCSNRARTCSKFFCSAPVQVAATSIVWPLRSGPDDPVAPPLDEGVSEPPPL